jgi:hypothetical protein
MKSGHEAFAIDVLIGALFPVPAVHARRRRRPVAAP